MLTRMPLILLVLLACRELQAIVQEIRVELLPPCESNARNPARFEGVVQRLSRNRYAMNGSIVVKETIRGPAEVIITTRRCSLDMAECEDFDKSTFSELCKRLRDGTPFAKNFFDNIEPPFTCPLIPMSYDLSKGVIDINLVAQLPLGGYYWLSSVTMLQGDRRQRRKKIIFCLNVKTSIIKTKKEKKT